MLLIDEAVLALRVWGWLKLPARYATADSVEVTTLSARQSVLCSLASAFGTQVEIVSAECLFKVNLCARFRAIMTLLPVTPFRQRMRIQVIH